MPAPSLTGGRVNTKKQNSVRAFNNMSADRRKGQIAVNAKPVSPVIEDAKTKKSKS